MIISRKCSIASRLFNEEQRSYLRGSWEAGRWSESHWQRLDICCRNHEGALWSKCDLDLTVCLILMKIAKDFLRLRFADDQYRQDFVIRIEGNLREKHLFKTDQTFVHKSRHLKLIFLQTRYISCWFSDWGTLFKLTGGYIVWYWADRWSLYKGTLDTKLTILILRKERKIF